MSNVIPAPGSGPRLALQTRRVLYFAPVGGAFGRFFEDLDRAGGGSTSREGELPSIELDGTRVEWCDASLPHEATALLDTAYMNAKSIGVGDTVYCQYWSRDPSAPWTTGLTNGLLFTVCP